MRKKTSNIIYISCVLLILIIPFVGMIKWTSNQTTENKELSKWPQLIEDGRVNVYYLSEAGAYFEDHFAFREYLVTANAKIRGEILRSSATNQAVIGSDDWLYFTGTLDDYEGKELLSDRELYAVTHNLVLIQNYVQERGSQFALAIAPNKNTLYDQNMPYYYLKGTDSNLRNLEPLLHAYGVNYVNLYDAFRNEDEILYFKRDSHWNNKGAVLAYNVMLRQMEIEHETYLNVPYEEKENHSGDIEKMLYPLAVEKETDYYYNNTQRFQYVGDVTDNMDDWIETSNESGEGSLLMFRDSFGESLLPFFAGEFQKGFFSRLVPYNLLQVNQYRPSAVIIERVERRISSFAEEPAVMEAPIAENLVSVEAKTDSTIEAKKEGTWLIISGEIEQDYIKDHTEIYVSVRGDDYDSMVTYNAFYTVTEDGDGNGYQMYLREEQLPQGNLHINVITVNQNQSNIVATKDL